MHGTSLVDTVSYCACVVARILAGDTVGSVVLLNMLSNAEETPNGVPEYMGRVSDLCSSVIACTWVLLLFAGLLHLRRVTEFHFAINYCAIDLLKMVDVS